jgi:molybdopterin-guanine dinucleotide biosynthesis protein A
LEDFPHRLRSKKRCLQWRRGDCGKLRDCHPASPPLYLIAIPANAVPVQETCNDYTIPVPLAQSGSGNRLHDRENDVRSAVILVGGNARRASGHEKYFFVYEGKTFIERLVGSLRSVVDEIILVARDPGQCGRFDHIPGIRCITDIRTGIGPVGGLHAGSLAAHGDLIFVSACDMPCIDTAVVAYLFSRIDRYDAAIPTWNPEMLEPLHAVYRRDALLKYLESHDSLSLRALVGALNTRHIPVEELKQFDPKLKTLTNINKLDDLKQLKADALKQKDYECNQKNNHTQN